jgi:hypothetical protein
MRKRTQAAALLVCLASAAPGLAQGTASGRQPFSFTPSSFTYTRVDTSKAIVPSTSSSSAKSLGNFQQLPINVTKALQQSFNPFALANNDPTRALRPRQPTTQTAIPNVFSRITSLSLVPTFLQPRTTTTTFPNLGPQKQ